MPDFKLKAPFAPTPAQTAVIDRLTADLRAGKADNVLLGVTGSGKTFTMANVIANLGRPTLVISHNKTLAAQLFAEFRGFFPDNAVAFFVSYYDYYQPEAYLPASDLYIEKEATINARIERLRLAATTALMSRRDVIVVASVSCIYGIGSPEAYREMTVQVKVGETIPRDILLARLVAIFYERNDIAFTHGTFRVRGDVVEVFPGYDDTALRIESFGDTIERITAVHPLTGEVLENRPEVLIFPATHFVVGPDAVANATRSIRHELQERLKELTAQNLLVEAQRLQSRTQYDLEMLQAVGHCGGIENYTRHLSGRAPGLPPDTLVDFFPDDRLVVIDESHATIPQIGGMYAGDRSRKETLVRHGFRLPSALDNRPLRFDEFTARVPQAVYVSATPAAYELHKAGAPVELVVRPTGLIDPPIMVRPTKGQVPDLLEEIRRRTAGGERVLVTTLTKKMAEELSAYIGEAGIKGEYLHSEIDTIARIEILRRLRKGDFDVLVGVNLLREGLDLPEVSLVVIMDADKEGFLRSETSLIQTIGRTARNVNAAVILYADTVTGSMQRAMAETDRRRRIQVEYNRVHSITPTTIKKGLMQTLPEILEAEQLVESLVAETEAEYITIESLRELEAEMLKAADELRFEDAAMLRDRIDELKAQRDGTPPPTPPGRGRRNRRR
ncbi:MAG: excinuclease ABC subunit UvrB [Planctomycetota bacterium]